MRNGLITILFLAFGAILLGIMPILQLFDFLPADFINPTLMSLMNLMAWGLLFFIFIRQHRLKNQIISIADDLGISLHLRTIEEIAANVIQEIQRKNASLSVNIIEEKIKGKEELSRSLEKIVSLAYHLLRAESVELALFDIGLNSYHSSYVVGKPFSTSAQAMLSGAAEYSAHEKYAANVMVQPIAFAGSVLGTLRVALAKEEIPSINDREVLRIIALQSGLAILNASYTEELMRMKRFADESVKVKTGFLANLSHEIRGPLGVMLNAIELVTDGLCGEISDEQKETLNMVKSNGEHLLDLINDVLDYAKIEAGKIIPQPANIIVSDLLNDVVSIMRVQAETKSHALIYKESSDVMTINVDKRHIRQMLINLITNAIKYTPDGGKIEIWAEREVDNHIKINVKDNGIGIEEVEKEKVFAPFERIRNSYSIKQNGTGIGMAVTKKLAEVNGGTVNFESTYQEGSHFWLSFPAVQLDALDINSEEDKGEEKIDGKDDLILLMESNPEEKVLMSKYLLSVGFTVESVLTPLEAINILNTKNVKLLLVENSLVDRQHEELIKSIREDSAGSTIPIVLLSSRAFTFDVEKYLKEGVDICLSKPISLHKIASACRKAIDDSLPQSVEKSSQKEI